MSEPRTAPPADDIFDSAVLIVCDDAGALAGYRESLRERGYRVIAETDPLHAASRLRDGTAISVVFTDIGAGQRLAPLFAAGATEPEVEFVAAAGDGKAMLEGGTARQTEWLVKPFDRAQFLGAIDTAFNLARMQRFRRQEMRTLEESLEEFRTRTLAAVSQLMTRARGLRAMPPGVSLPDAAILPLIEEENRRGRLRQRILGPQGLGHANWMLLLVLAEARLKAEELTVKSAAYAAGLPLSSALRKINAMCEAGLLEKTEDPHDSRRSFVALAPGGLPLLTRYFSEIAAGRSS